MDLRKTWQQNRRAPWNILGLVGILVLAGGAGAFVLGQGVDAGEHEPVAKADEYVRLHMRVYDTASHLLLSTDPEDLDELEAVRAAWPGAFRVPALEESRSIPHRLDTPARPIPIGNAAGAVDWASLVERPVGATAIGPVVGHLSYNQTFELERLRGPFNLTLITDNAYLANATTAREGDLLVIDDLFEARLVEEGANESMLRLDLEDGQVLQVRRANFTAVVQLDENGEQFWLRLGTEQGHAFTLSERCKFARYVLPWGTYRVASTNETHIVVDRAPTRWPQLLERDLIMVLELAELDVEGPPSISQAHGS